MQMRAVKKGFYFASSGVALRALLTRARSSTLNAHYSCRLETRVSSENAHEMMLYYVGVTKMSCHNIKNIVHFKSAFNHEI
jgi:hypothetical protein